MRSMPNPPRTEGLTHEVAVDALQKWLWQAVAAGWDPSNPDSGHWSHDDNLKAMQLGWMISQAPNSEYVDLFSLKQGVKAHDVMKAIVRAATIDPVCAKAVTVLTAQKLKFPDVRFAFDEAKQS